MPPKKPATRGADAAAAAAAAAAAKGRPPPKARAAPRPKRRKAPEANVKAFLGDFRATHGATLAQDAAWHQQSLDTAAHHEGIRAAKVGTSTKRRDFSLGQAKEFRAKGRATLAPVNMRMELNRLSRERKLPESLESLISQLLFGPAST